MKGKMMNTVLYLLRCELLLVTRLLLLLKDSHKSHRTIRAFERT